MDFSLMKGIGDGLAHALTIGRAALEIRDANLLNTEVARLNNVLLSAQEGLFRLSNELLALQQQHFEAIEELRKIREAMTERDRYEMFEIGSGVMAYRYQQPLAAPVKAAKSRRSRCTTCVSSAGTAALAASPSCCCTWTPLTGRWQNARCTRVLSAPT